MSLARFATLFALAMVTGCFASEAATTTPDEGAQAESALATAPQASVTVTTVLANMTDAVDFGVRPRLNDFKVLLLRSTPSRVEACTLTGQCTVEIGNAQMPGQFENASMAVNAGYDPAASGYGGLFWSIFVAQKGNDTCATDCDSPLANGPGLFEVAAGRSPRRFDTTLPHTFGKAFRRTNGWLETATQAAGDVVALAQESNNEDFTAAWTTVWTFDDTNNPRVLKGPQQLYTRGGGRNPLQPFVVGGTSHGYVGASGGLFSMEVGLRAVEGTPTSITSDVGNVWVARDGTPGQLAIIPTAPIAVPATLPFAGVTSSSKLFEWNHALLSYTDAPTASPIILYCDKDHVAARDCSAPKKVTLPIDQIVRLHEGQGSLLVLGKVGARFVLLRVTPPN